MPTDNEINGWLVHINFDFRFPIRRLEYNHWQLDIKNSVADYTIDIFDQGAWITYSAVLLHDVAGRGKGTFYRSMLELNAQLNGISIGIEDNKLILTTATTNTMTDFPSFGQSIALVDNAHQIVFPYMLNEINRLGLTVLR